MATENFLGMASTIGFAQKCAPRDAAGAQGSRTGCHTQTQITMLSAPVEAVWSDSLSVNGITAGGDESED